MNMRRFIFILIVCEFMSLACIAANKTIKGHVVDEFGKNVEFASVYVDSIYAVSDREGKNSPKRSEFLGFYLYFCHAIQNFVCFYFATLR